ncbi:unnamed protein product [Lupinus luteus]|uniref:Uncharacterized protein n=1 Tax=Lupinus luteus TaxID=3873 RepID=A0AAV1WJ90_LUPLU
MAKGQCPWVYLLLGVKLGASISIIEEESIVVACCEDAYSRIWKEEGIDYVDSDVGEWLPEDGQGGGEDSVSTEEVEVVADSLKVLHNNQDFYVRICVEQMRDAIDVDPSISSVNGVSAGTGEKTQPFTNLAIALEVIGKEVQLEEDHQLYD